MKEGLSPPKLKDTPGDERPRTPAAFRLFFVSLLIFVFKTFFGTRRAILNLFVRNFNNKTSKETKGEKSGFAMSSDERDVLGIGFVR